MMSRLLPLTLALSISSAYAADTLDLAALNAQIQAQQQQLDALKSQLNQQPATTTSSALNDTIAKTSISGYGEALFTHVDNAADQYDAYRFVLYVGHQFSDTVRLHSELEIEHGLVADTDVKDCTNDPATNKVTCKSNPKVGEVELEQMFIEWKYAQNHAVSIGQLLVPVGMINEFHEPETFYGVKRNAVETNVIPTTWWEGGVKASGNIGAVDGLSYDLMVNTGLKTTDASIRSSRQKGAKATAEDLAYTGRVRYVSNGLHTGLTYQHQTDLGQGGTTKDNSADLIEVHASYNWQGLGLKALYAQWDIDGLSGTANAQKSKQDGFFVETNYRLGNLMALPLDSFGVFARYSEWDLAAANDKNGLNSNSKVQQWNYGFNYFLTPQVVMKVDVQAQDHFDKSKADEDGFNLGIGYSF